LPIQVVDDDDDNDNDNDDDDALPRVPPAADGDDADGDEDDDDDVLCGFGTEEKKLYRKACAEAKGDELKKTTQLLADLCLDRTARATKKDDQILLSDAGIPRREGQRAFKNFGMFLSVLVPVLPVPDTDNDSEVSDSDPDYAVDTGIVEVVPVAEALAEGLCDTDSDMDGVGGPVLSRDLHKLLIPGLFPLQVTTHSPTRTGMQANSGRRGCNNRYTSVLGRVGPFVIEVLRQDIPKIVEMLSACDFGCRATAMMDDDVFGPDFFLTSCQDSLTSGVLARTFERLEPTLVWVRGHGMREPIQDEGTAMEQLRDLIRSDTDLKRKILNWKVWATAEERNEREKHWAKVNIDVAFCPYAGQVLKREWDPDDRYGFEAPPAGVNMGTVMCFERDPTIAVVKKSVPGVAVTVFKWFGLGGGGLKLTFSSGAAGPKKDYGLGKLGEDLYLAGLKKVIFYNTFIRVVKAEFKLGPLPHLIDKASTFKKLATAFGKLRRVLKRAMDLQNVIGDDEESAVHRQTRYEGLKSRVELRFEPLNGDALPSDEDLQLLPCRFAAILIATLRRLGYVPKLVHPYLQQSNALKELDVHSCLLNHDHSAKVFTFDPDGTQSNKVIIGAFEALGYTKADFNDRKLLNDADVQRDADRRFLNNHVTPVTLLLS
jgi:hypothetical protein